MEAFRGYGKHIELHSADHLNKHATDNGQIIVIEYDVHGRILATNVPYNNRFCSIIILGETPDCTLEGLHGFPRRLERADVESSCLTGTRSRTEAAKNR